MKHLTMITVLSIYSLVVQGSDSIKKNDVSCSDTESTISDSYFAKEIVAAAISKNLTSDKSISLLEECAKKGNLEDFAQALVNGEKPSEQKWVHSVHYDPTQTLFLGLFPKDPWLIKKVNLQEYLTLSSTTSSAGLISFTTAEKMLKMLDVASTKEWSELDQKEKYVKLMTEASKKDNKDKEGACC